MARIRPLLARAPIAEALIDLQFPPNKSSDLKAVHAFAGQLDGYDNRGPILQLQTNWSVTKDEGARNVSQSHELGVRLHSTDEKYVMQARANGFTLSRLEPYESWDRLVSEARRLWQIYEKVLQPKAITRVATRYINLLKLPMSPGEHFEEYLTKPPQVPTELPQGVMAFLQRMVILHPELGAAANVIQLLQEGPAPSDHVPIILDIDVYKVVQLSPEAADAWNLLGQLRTFKNAVFFAHVTEKTVGLLE